MNKLVTSRILVRLLQNEIHHSVFSRSIQTSVCVRTTKSKEDDEAAKSDGDKASESPRSSSTTKNLFGTLAGMKAISSRDAHVVTKAEQKDEPDPLMEKTRDNVTSNFKTSEALKSAMTQAVKTVSDTFPDKEKTESDLLQQLRRYDEAKAAGERGEVGSAISSLLTGMKVQDKQTRTKEEVRELRQEEGIPRRQFLRERIQDGEKMHRTQGVGFRETRSLGIFSPPEEKTKTDVAVHDEPPMKTIWDKHEENELKEYMYAQHRHGFDEMIEWTTEGKLWKYPIDNEQGLEEEQAVGFHEHVLLDDLIADFPKTGPIRDFMELVIVGLSKNPYFTVKQKKEHIDWFRQYFKDKEDVLRENETIPKEFNFT